MNRTWRLLRRTARNRASVMDITATAETDEPASDAKQETATAPEDAEPEDTSGTDAMAETEDGSRARN